MTDHDLICGLREAGCDQEAVQRICHLYEEGGRADAISQMKIKRCQLIEQMHTSQKRVDRMDYLIHQLQKEEPL